MHVCMQYIATGSWITQLRVTARLCNLSVVAAKEVEIAYIALVIDAFERLHNMGGKVDVASGADDPRRPGKGEKVKQVRT